MNAKLTEGIPVDPKDRETIRKAIDRFGNLFLTKKARDCQRVGKDLPSDPFAKDWIQGRGYSAIFSEIKGDVLRKGIYAPFSSWHHWTCEEMASVISRGVNKVTWLPPSDREAARVLATTFQCLFEVTEVADIYLKLGFAAQLANVRDAYVSSVSAPIGEVE